MSMVMPETSVACGHPSPWGHDHGGLTGAWSGDGAPSPDTTQPRHLVRGDSSLAMEWFRQRRDSMAARLGDGMAARWGLLQAWTEAESVTCRIVAVPPESLVGAVEARPRFPAHQGVGIVLVVMKVVGFLATGVGLLADQ